MSVTRLFVLLFLLSAVGVPSMGAAATPTSHSQAMTLAASLMSPFCPGRLLSECGSQQAFVLREEMSRRIEAGESEDAIVDDLVARYGQEILGAPPLEGFGVLAWTLPILLAAVSLAVVVAAISRATTRHGTTGAAAVEHANVEDAAMAGRLDDELHALD